MELSPRLSVHYIDFHLSRSKSSMIVFHSPTKRGETWQLTFRISASSSNLLCFHRQDRTILAVPGLVTPPPSSHHPFTILQTVVVAVGQEGIFGTSWVSRANKESHKRTRQAKVKSHRIRRWSWGDEERASHSTAKIYLTIWCNVQREKYQKSNNR